MKPWFHCSKSTEPSPQLHLGYQQVQTEWLSRFIPIVAHQNLLVLSAVALSFSIHK